MSLDTLVSLALFAGALFLMMRFGCGAHMGHAHGHDGTHSDHSDVGGRSNAGGGGLPPLNGVNGPLPVKNGEEQ